MTVMDWKPPLGGKLNIDDDEPGPEVVVVDANASPLDFMQAVYRDASQPMTRRMKAAEVAMPFVHAKLEATMALDQLFAARIEEMARDRGINPVIDAKR
jgi:hypothetical protein